MGNGRQNHKFSSPKNRGGILLYCAGADGNTCGQKSSGDEKQLEWPNRDEFLSAPALYKIAIISLAVSGSVFSRHKTSDPPPAHTVAEQKLYAVLSGSGARRLHASSPSDGVGH